MHLPPHANLIALCLIGAALLLAATFFLANPTPPPQALVRQPVAVNTASTASPVLDAESALILELFSPSDAALSSQLSETALSQRIEQILVTSYVLTRCNILSQEEYRDTFLATLAYATSNQLATTSAEVQARVRVLADSAGASYSFVYHRTRCDDPKLATIATQLKTWREAYLK